MPLSRGQQISRGDPEGLLIVPEVTRFRLDEHLRSKGSSLREIVNVTCLSVACHSQS